jgi:carbamoyltransferase
LLLGPRRRPGEPLTPRHADIAAALQKVTDKALLDLAAALRQRTASSRLCLAGGVALNCVSNRVVQESGLFEELYIQPAAHDAGTALGAAAWLWCQRSGGDRSFVLQHPYLGPGYSDAELIAALEHSGLRYRRSADPAVEAAALIADGDVVGWFQGRMEVGPRALGNRSLLADPRRPDMREVINEKVKHRESFQPFAPAVLAERAADWFRIPGRSRSSDFMLFAYDARPEQATRIPAVVHADGTSRIQTVRRETNPLFHRLIAEFEHRTGVPLVLNTSFNDSEPIVCSPEDALRTFGDTRIDGRISTKALWIILQSFRRCASVSRLASAFRGMDPPNSVLIAKASWPNGSPSSAGRPPEILERPARSPRRADADRQGHPSRRRGVSAQGSWMRS